MEKQTPTTNQHTPNTPTPTQNLELMLLLELPPHEQLPLLLERLTGEAFREDVPELIGRVDLLKDDAAGAVGVKLRAKPVVL